MAHPLVCHHFFLDLKILAKNFCLIGCGGVLTSPEGSITSPGYPSAYHRSSVCVWEIRVSKGSRIRFNFVDVDFGTVGVCRSDYVDIFDGGNLRSKKLGRYCSIPSDPIVSKGSSLIVRFRAGRSSNQGIILIVVEV